MVTYNRSVVVVASWLFLFDATIAFLPSRFTRMGQTPIHRAGRVRVSVVDESLSAAEEEFVIDFDPLDYVEDDTELSTTTTTTEQRGGGGPKWHSLDPETKAKIMQEGQERAIRNKKAREPAHRKKRRMLKHFANLQKEKQKASRVPRDLSFADRVPLSNLTVDEERVGKVISLTRFGAYVDVGSERDGLLHVSQISNTIFVEHPRQVFRPGDEVTVRIREVNPEAKVLHLTMLSPDLVAQQRREKEHENMEDRIPLEDLRVDDELWGELKRVTDFGSYVEVGARVDGWLHFMDHPAFAWSEGGHPSDYMTIGDRVRVWVADVDLGLKRIKLTANRPEHLPGPRREFS